MSSLAIKEAGVLAVAEGSNKSQRNNIKQFIQLDRQKAADRFVRGPYKKPQSEDYIRRMIWATLSMPTNSAMALILGGIVSDNRPRWRR